jgi:hypothetical protein
MTATIGDLIYYNGEEGEPPCFGVVSSIKNKHVAVVAWPFPDKDGDVTSEIDIEEVYTGDNYNLTVMAGKFIR